MCEQTRQQIAADLEYARGQLRLVPLNTVRNHVDGVVADRIARALDALERVQSYLERADGPSTVPAGWDVAG